MASPLWALCSDRRLKMFTFHFIFCIIRKTASIVNEILRAPPPQDVIQVKRKRNLKKLNCIKLNGYNQRYIYKIHIYKYTNVRCPCAFSTACMRMISLHFFKAARFWNLDSNHMAGGLETPGLHVRGWGTRLPWHAVRPTAGLLLGVAANLPCGQLVLQAPGWDLPLALSHLRQVGRQEGTTGDS